MTLLPEYRAQLYTVAERRARRRAKSLVRVLPVAVSTAIVLGMAVAAVATLSHRPASRASARSGTTGSTPAASTPNAPTLTALTGPLVDMLGVLRRPQTEADLQTWVPGFFSTFASPACRAANTRYQCTLRLDRPLIREVDALGSGYRVGLLPYTSAGTIAGLAVTLRGPGINYLAAGPWTDTTIIPPGLSELRTQGLMLSAYASEGVNSGAIVVPDGVARVVIGPLHLVDRSLTRRVAPTAGASAAVFDNVAVFQLNGLTAQSLELRPAALRHFFMESSGPSCQPTFAIYRLPAESHMVWLAPDGTVVNHTLIRIPVFVGVQHPAPGTTITNPGCPASG